MRPPKNYAIASHQSVIAIGRARSIFLGVDFNLVLLGTLFN
jgi:hypothetical protein